jgi:hypothetical protein
MEETFKYVLERRVARNKVELVTWITCPSFCSVKDKAINPVLERRIF